jgi:hypothetical protein
MKVNEKFYCPMFLEAFVIWPLQDLQGEKL